jgi:3-hydroxyacyl-CoA dehydrogenase/enoyl-CoA hydratase/3-hydroxybutyryl-CoA epimerase
MASLSIEKRPDGVAVITFDTPSSPINILSRALFDEFAYVIDDIESDPGVRAVVFASGKRDSFIAGANVKEFFEIRLPIEGEQFSRVGHTLLDRIAHSPKPFVAAIHGAAFGGGLEVALACRYRIATDDPKTVLALPEVTLGLLPGGGGTQRLPRAVGLREALPMLLTGKRVRARRALRMGLVDAVVPAHNLVETAALAARRLVDRRLVARVPKRGLVDRAIELPLVRSFVLDRARKEVVAKTRGNYPAPLMTLHCVETGLSRGERAGFEQESVGFGTLTASPEAKSLIRLFLLTTDTKKHRGAAEPRAVDRLAVLGAGFMGAGIAGVSLPHGPVVLKDVSLDAIGRGVKTIDEGLASRVRSGSLSRVEADRQRSRLAPATDPASVARADLVVEAVFEDLDLKRRVLAETEAHVAPEAVIASNTSALPIHEIAAHAERPERVLGMHYFSPVHKMPLLEIVAAATTADWAVETARAFGIRQGKTVIVVRDGPGFYTTRILAPFLNEATALVEEGAEIAAIDRALKSFGYPVGPMALMDEVGIDVGAHVSEFLGQAFSARGLEPSDALARMAAAGYAGRKNRRGFYRYDAGRGKGPKQVDERVYAFFGGGPRREISAREMADRLCLLMVNEAVHCLQEEIIASPSDGDVGAVLGLGFPPFRGGPFRYVDTVGAAAVVDSLEAFARRLGPRFLPAPLLVDAAREGKRFT